jgi:hypothetical protein
MRARFQVPPKARSEHQEQTLVVQILRLEYPDVEALLFAIPNGGHRHPGVGAKLKAEGVKAGIPDLFLAIPAHEYHGLFIEMKKPGGATSKAQLEWHQALRDQGYKVAIAYGHEEALEIIEEYAL